MGIENRVSLTRANASAAAAIIRQAGGANSSVAADSCAFLAKTGETVNYSGRPMSDSNGGTLFNYGFVPGKYHWLHNPTGKR